MGIGLRAMPVALRAVPDPGLFVKRLGHCSVVEWGRKVHLAMIWYVYGRPAWGFVARDGVPVP